MIYEFLLPLVPLLLLSLGAVRRQHALSPVRMFLYGWLMTLGCVASYMVQFETKIHTQTFLILVFSQLAFLAGVLLAIRSERPATVNPDRAFAENQAFQIMIALTIALSLIGVLHVVRDLSTGHGRALLLHGLSPGLKEIRDSSWSSFYRGETEVSPIRSIGITCCLLVSALTPYFLRKRYWLCLPFAGLAILSVFAESFLQAERFSLGLLMLILFVSAALSAPSGTVSRIITLPRVVVGGLLGFYLFIFFPVQRNPDLPGTVERNLGWAADASFPPWVHAVSRMEGMEWFKIFAYSTSYFSKAVDKLNYFVLNSDFDRWYAMGLYNVPLISQIQGAVSDAPSGWLQIRLRISELMMAEGWSRNPWCTGVRDLAIDFGYIGALIVLVALGYLAQGVFLCAQRTRNPFILSAGAYASAAALIFSFISPFQIRMLGNGLWFLAGIGLGIWILMQLTRPVPASPVPTKSISPGLQAR